MGIIIREMTALDATAVAALSGELGYPVSAEEMQRRIEQLTPKSDHVLFVACEQEQVVGWIDVALSQHLVSPPSGLIGGLIVSDSVRGRGIGHALVRRAEEWTTEAGASKLMVRSRVERERAHEFYLQQNFFETKRQVVFVKEL